MKLINKTQNHSLATTLIKAQSFYARFRGLMGQKQLPLNTALWIPKCKSIHTCFMRFNIDVLFVDKNLQLIAVYHNLKPWRITKWHFKACSVFELSSNATQACKAKLGDTLYVET